MLTLDDIYEIMRDQAFLGKVIAATWIAALAIQTEDPPPANHAERLAWAESVFQNPKAIAQRMLMALLVDHRQLTKTQVLEATDTTIETAVAGKVDDFANGSA